MVKQMNQFRLLVTGSRQWTDSMRIEYELRRIRYFAHELGWDLKLILGDCPTGADKMAREWAVSEEVAHQVFIANWDGLGLGAGPARNMQMVASGRPHLAIGFLKLDLPNRGTEHCLAYAATNGVPVKRVVGI